MNAQLPPDLMAQLGGAPAPAAAPEKEPYAQYLKVGFLVIAALLIGGLGWSALAQIKGAVLAPGLVAVDGKPKTVQHLDGGVVGEILVTNGQMVSEGDVLMRLDPTEIQANQEIVQLQYNETFARAVRLKAERDEQDVLVWPQELLDAADQPRVAQAMTGQQQLFEARRAADQGMVRQLRQRINQLKDQISGLFSLNQSTQQQLRKIREEAEAKRTLVKKGYLGKPAVLALERELLRLSGQIATNASEMDRLNGQINETQTQIAQLERDHRSEILTELRATEAELSGFSEQLTSASAQSSRVSVTAPVSGTIHELAVTTIGGVVTPGQELMQIIPSGAELIVQVNVDPIDIDQIHLEQKATVRLSAFNARRTPELDGIVTKIAPDRVIDPITGMPYYTVEVDIPDSEIARLSSDLTLIPGMPAEAFMQTESRSVLSYLLKPATDAMRRAGREE